MNMTNKKIKILLGAILFLGLVAYLIDINYKQLQIDNFQKFDTYTGHMRIDDYEFINNGDAVVIHLSEKEDKYSERMKKYGGNSSKLEKYAKVLPSVPHQSGGGYLVLYNEALKNKYHHKDDYEKDEYKELIIYKKQGNKLKESKTDIIKIEERIGKTINVIASGKLTFLKNSHVALEVFIDGDYHYIDLENNQVVAKSQAKSIAENIDFISLFNSVNRTTNYFNKIGFSKIKLSAAGDIDNANKEQRNHLATLPFAKKYPRAYKLLLKENSALSMLTPNGNPELDSSVQVLSLFYKNGTEGLFQNVNIESFDSIDGQEHTVTSYEEFKKYYKYAND